MRFLFVLTLFVFSLAATAQTPVAGGYIDHLQRQSFLDNVQPGDSIPVKKWSVNRYAGISTSIGFFNGGTATVMAVPIGIQINRRLTNNWYAFAGVSVAPAYTSFNHSFLSSNTGKPFQNGRYASSGPNAYSRAEMGLMYVNDQKTFSISGSISVERSSSPLIPVYQSGAKRPATFNSPVQ